MPSDNPIIVSLRDFPAVEILASEPLLAAYADDLTRPLVVQVIREALERLKDEFPSLKTELTRDQMLAAIRDELERTRSLILRPVINGTGIVIHTNLGRAPLDRAMIERALEVLTGYSNLEFDLSGGRRGVRGVMVERLLALLCGTPAGTLVNNNAAALFVILNTLAARREVVISRGELIQIGGGFRIPEIMVRSGVKLVEVGTTNRTMPDDYRAAVTGKTAMILKVHRSNFAQAGFVEETPLKALSAICRERDLILVHDLGSGLVELPPQVEIRGEPSVTESVRAGADLTCFSGDKLLGGVQTGLIAGRADLISRIKKNPLFRTVRCDKIVFALMAQVLTSYLKGSHYHDISVWRLISIPVAELKSRGERILAACRGKDLALIATHAYLGGGSTPGQAIPSLALSLRSELKPDRLAARFRTFTPPIIGRVEENQFLIDLRAIEPENDRIIIEAINQLLD